MRHNIWLLAIGNNNPITAKQAIEDIQALQHDDKLLDPVTIVIAKRDSKATPTHIEQDWATFDQMRIVPHHIIDSDATPHKSIKAIPISSHPSPPQLNHTTPQQSILHNDTISTQSDHVIPIVTTHTTNNYKED